MVHICNVSYYVRKKRALKYFFLFFQKKENTITDNTWKINQELVFYYLYSMFESEVEVVRAKACYSSIFLYNSNFRVLLLFYILKI